MKKAIYVRLFIIALVTALLSGGISAIAAAIQEEHQTRDNLVQLCRTAGYQYETTPQAAALSDILGGERVTIIAPDGAVLDDSQSSPDTMKNHADREEVRAAREGSVVTASRHSETLGQPFMYAATQLPDGNILRLAHGYGGIMKGISGQLPVFLISFIIAAFVAILIARRFTKKILAPLEQFTDRITAGDYEAIQENGGYYEIDKITERIHELLSELSASQQKILAQHEKTNFILSNMGEGFVLLDDRHHIVLLNTSAKQIFGITESVEGQNLLTLTRERKLQDSVNNAVSRQISSVFDLRNGGTVYSVRVSPVSGEYVDSEGVGATVLLIDVGAERTSQSQRSEFFSNASHELKTPITTILALSEMLEKGLMEKNSNEGLYARIHTEAKRMNQLLSDILTISRLESGLAADPVEFVEMRDVAGEIIQSLTPIAEAGQVSIALDCDDCHAYANRQRIRELLKNLVENAVKYNKPSGRVEVGIKKHPGQIKIQISDTGIGIPPEAQPRIFERFFRVDSGRSKDVGGTGLGLAIVKHIVINLGGEINLKSKPGAGTQITVTFPTGAL